MRPPNFDIDQPFDQWLFAQRGAEGVRGRLAEEFAQCWQTCRFWSDIGCCRLGALRTPAALELHMYRDHEPAPEYRQALDDARREWQVTFGLTLANRRHDAILAATIRERDRVWDRLEALPLASPGTSEPSGYATRHSDAPAFSPVTGSTKEGAR